MENESRLSRLRRLTSLVTLEPPLFIQTFSFGLSLVIGQNLLIEKSCRDLGYSDSICSDINHHATEYEEVEKKVTVLQLYISILAAIPSIILALFIGPWSDKNGRKPILIAGTFGFFLNQIVWLFNVYFRDAPAIYLLSTSVYAFFGGFPCMLIGVFSYLTDITTVRSRTSRIAFMDFCVFSGIPLGTFASAYIYKYFGYYGIFGSVAAGQFLSGIYIVFLIKETVVPDNSLASSTSYKYLSIIDFDHLKESFYATFRKRQHKLRRVILLLIFCMLLNITTLNDGNILYLYTRQKFDWTEQQYTKYTSVSICLSSFSTILLMPLLSYFLKVHDAMIAIISAMSKIASLVVVAIAKDGYALYFSAVIGSISSLQGIVIRSMLSKCVQHDELGKIFSLLASLEAAVPLFAAPLITIIYNSTLDQVPGAVFLALSSLFLVILVVMTYVFYILTRTGQDFSLLVEVNDDLNDSIASHENVLHSDTASTS